VHPHRRQQPQGIKIKANIAIRTIIYNWYQRYNLVDDIIHQNTSAKAIVFGKTLKRKPIIKLGTTILPIKEDTRYPGIILDETFYFSKHINTFLEKAKRQLNRILTLASKSIHTIHQYNPSEKVQSILVPYF